MKIKRINDNTISCTITPEDLKANGFELDDFFEHKKEAVDFIRQTVAQIAISENFDLQGEMTTMRVSVLPDHSLNLLITREDTKEGAASEVRRLARSIFDSLVSKAAEKTEKEGADQDSSPSGSLMKSLLSGRQDKADAEEEGQQQGEKVPAVPDAFMFSFYSVRDAMDCCKLFAQVGPVESSLYYLREDDIYFLIVRRTRGTLDNFEKCVLSANEFGELVTSEEQYIAFVTEHGISIAADHAVEMFMDVIPVHSTGDSSKRKKKADLEESAGRETAPDFLNGAGEA